MNHPVRPDDGTCALGFSNSSATALNPGGEAYKWQEVCAPGMP
jgi:hypothetical protein